MHDQRRQRKLILLATAAVVLLLAGVGAAALLWPRPIVTLEDAVAVVLDRRGITYQRITTSRAHPFTGIYFSYAFNVSVQLSDGGRAVGTIDCSPSQSACFVDMRRLGVHYERLPALEHDTRGEWLVWVQRALKGVGILAP